MRQASSTETSFRWTVCSSVYLSTIRSARGPVHHQGGAAGGAGGGVGDEGGGGGKGGGGGGGSGGGGAGGVEGGGGGEGLGMKQVQPPQSQP